MRPQWPQGAGLDLRAVRPSGGLEKGTRLSGLRNPPHEPKRAEVRFDKYAIFDLAGEHHLTPHARWLLVALCLRANFRTRSVVGRICELAEWTGMSRDTIRRCLNTLSQAGLVEEVEPFGPNRSGQVLILAWDGLLVPGASRRNADQPRAIRRLPADISANDQPKEVIARNRAIRKELEGNHIVDVETENSHDERCTVPGCIEKVEGHSFDHAPIAPGGSEGPDLFDVTGLTDEDLGLFPSDRQELDRCSAGNFGRSGMTEIEALSELFARFPNAVLVST